MSMGELYLIMSISLAGRLAGGGPPDTDDMGMEHGGCWVGGGLAGKYWMVLGALAWMWTLAFPTPPLEGEVILGIIPAGGPPPGIAPPA